MMGHRRAHRSKRWVRHMRAKLESRTEHQRRVSNISATTILTVAIAYGRLLRHAPPYCSLSPDELLDELQVVVERHRRDDDDDDDRQRGARDALRLRVVVAITCAGRILVLCSMRPPLSSRIALISVL